MYAHNTGYNFDKYGNVRIKNTTEIEGVEMDEVDPDKNWVDADDKSHVTTDVNTQSQPEIKREREHDWSQIEKIYEDEYLDMLSDRYQ